MITREHYIEPIRPFYESDLIKIITGIRRCGKSVLLSQIREEIEHQGKDVLFLDFEDVAVLNAIPDCTHLIEYVSSHRKKGKCYLFCDEIQRVEDWASACRTLRLRDCSLFISGSNSKLLSREFTKELSGRYVSFRIRPFVYFELLAYGKELGKEVSIPDYLIWGGFPKRLEFPTLAAQKTYLNDLNETIIVNDIINRYHIKKAETFRAIANYVLVSNARILSVRSIHAYLKENGIACSLTTASNYIHYLEEAFAISPLRLYSPKAKRELDYYQKVYDEDVSFHSIRCMGERYDLTHNLENVVCNELLYRGHELQVYNDGKGEIDFVAAKEGKKYLIQVAYSVAEEKTYQRELAPFARLGNENQKILITNDEVDFSTSTVWHIKLKDFLLMEDF